MTRALAVVTLAVAVLRLAGHIAVAISNEIDDALSLYLVEAPDFLPESMTADPL
jgi:hypothetical protein